MADGREVSVRFVAEQGTWVEERFDAESCTAANSSGRGADPG
jgi:hypothetical protein